MGRVRLWMLLLPALLMLAGQPLAAQLVPNAGWRTLRTEHFHVHYTPDVERSARRAAAYAEHAYRQLAERLPTPRGPIDLVVANNVDFSNGLATPFPSNRIIVYTHPPLSIPSLRFYDDWLELVVTHELVHIFHLDIAKSWWGLAQSVFGRSPFLMPNLYLPAWVVEGLATFYESELTGTGRVHGTHERMVVRAGVLQGAHPRLDQWVLPTTRFPGGEIAYAYGSLLFDYLAETRGDSTVEEFMVRTARQAVPYRLNHVARGSFGVSLQTAWEEWRDSLFAKDSETEPPLPGWRPLTRAGRLAFYPRWVDDTTLIYAANTGREVPGAHLVSIDGTVWRLGRRNGIDVNVAAPDGAIVYTQLEFQGAYRLFADLYEQRGGRERRLTRGARISEIDVRADGRIVAVQSVPGTTRLVLLDRDGGRLRAITRASLDTQWSEPRWSPEGARIAVTRWRRGGFANVVVLDSVGRLIHEITSDRAFDSSPSWTPDGRALVFASDRTGVAELYVAVLDDGCPAAGAGCPDITPDMDAGSRGAPELVPRPAAATPRRFSRAATGLFYPSVSPDGQWIAAVHFSADGWYVGLAPFDTTDADAPPIDPAFAAVTPRDPEIFAGPSHPYSPLRTLIPRYWVPLAGENTSGNVTWGLYTSGADVIGRHAYFAEAVFDPGGVEDDYGISYRYAGLGRPLLDLAAWQDWTRSAIVDGTGERVGNLQRRTRTYALGATLQRPRSRTNGWLTLRGEIESRDYLTDPPELREQLAPFFSSKPRFGGVLAAAGWSNARRPILSISPEDGISFSVAARMRWLEGQRDPRSRSISTILSGYKSLDFGGYAHHVLAARVAAGYADGTDPGEFSLGGTSGAPAALVPGIMLGERRTFAVRGFPVGARSGTRAVVGSAEYRFPLALPRRGWRLLPVYLDRTSLALFADAGSAWDGPTIPENLLRDAEWLASVGAELNLDAAFQYDVPYRVRIGVAAPVVDNSLFPTRSVSSYVRLGLSF